MYISGEKRKSNISEYLIYMFQVEDLIRSLQFDIERIEKLVIQKYDLPYNEKRDMREWYTSLIGHLRDNGLMEKGHCPFLNNLMNELNDLHLRLLQRPEEKKYHQLFANAHSQINELRMKSGNPEKHDITVCHEGLYGLLLLRLSKKKISPETEKAFVTISEMLAWLSLRFKEVDEGLTEI
jgi:hypothetical protein